jgi:hypothetical protein
MLPKLQENAFFDFFDATVDNDIFDKKTTLMIQLASALAIGCSP